MELSKGVLPPLDISRMQIHLCCFSLQISIIIINLPQDISSDSESPPCNINHNNSSIEWIYVQQYQKMGLGQIYNINFDIHIV